MHSPSFSGSFSISGFKLSSLICVFLLVQDERYMSNKILLHVDTQSFLSCLFTMLSFLWRFWQCCQKTDGCHLDLLLHWSTARLMPMIYLLFLSPFFCVHVYIYLCFHLHVRIFGCLCTFIHMYMEVQIDVKDHPWFFIEILRQRFSSKPRVPCYD